MNKEYLIKDLETQLKKMYGDEAKIEIVEPLVLGNGWIDEIRAFDGKVFIILHKNKESYTFDCPLMEDPKEKIKLADKHNAIIFPIPHKELPLLSEDKVKREYKICAKFVIPFYYPEIDIDSVKDFGIDEKYINPAAEHYKELKEIIKRINTSEKDDESDFSEDEDEKE